MTTLETAIRQIDRESRAAAAADVRRRQRELRASCFPALFGGGQAQARADRRRDPRLRRAGRGAAAGQAQHVDPPAVRRREGAHRDLARVRAVPAQSGAVLPARRGRRAARRSATPTASAAMVREMAVETQFLFISHNKITMEMAQPARSASRCRSRACRAWSRSTSPKRSSLPATRRRRRPRRNSRRQARRDRWLSKRPRAIIADRRTSCTRSERVPQ